MESFLKIDNKLLYATVWVTPDGVEEELPLGLKVLYSYKYSRWAFFVRGNGYYESHKACGEALGMSRRTVQRYCEKLKEMGLMSIKQVGFNEYHTTMHKLSDIKGKLVDKRTKRISNEGKTFIPEENLDQYKANVKEMQRLKERMKVLQEDMYGLHSVTFKEITID